MSYKYNYLVFLQGFGKKVEDKVFAEIKKVLKSSGEIKKISDIKSYLDNAETKKVAKDYIKKYPHYLKFLDEKFHTLINPKAFGPQKFWQVIYYYTLGYISIYKHFLSLDNKMVTKLLEEPEDYYNKFCTKIETLKKGEKSEKRYYNIIKKLMDKSPDTDFCFITTNYTPILDKLIKKDKQNGKGASENKIAYLHGKLSLFESAYQLKVFDFSEKPAGFLDASKKDILFPFIFLQSGVKPIICKEQIEEWAKAVDYLQKADCLIILGYGINSDDNHLNSLIRDFAERKKIYLFQRCDCQCCKSSIDKASEKEKLKSKLRLIDDEVIKNIEILPLSKKECYNVFKAEVEKIMKN